MCKLVFCISMIFLIAAAPLMADSLWPINKTSLTADPKATCVGDLITVLVVEQTVSTQEASTDYSKDFEHANQAGAGPFISLMPRFGFKSDQSSSASGQTTMSNNLISKLTATVTRILPNGNMEITGQRVLETNGEKQTMTMTATVRPQDLASDNTVSSTFLADLKYVYNGKGPVGDRQHEGVISRILKYIF